MNKKIIALIASLLLLFTCAGCATKAPGDQLFTSSGEGWYFGFGRSQFLPSENSNQPLYIAGYNSGVEISGVLDYCEARALWLDTGAEGILLKLWDACKVGACAGSSHCDITVLLCLQICLF